MMSSALGIVDAIRDALAALGQQEIATLTLTLGLIFFAVLAAIALVRTRKAADRVETVSREQTNELQAEIDGSRLYCCRSRRCWSLGPPLPTRPILSAIPA